MIKQYRLRDYKFRLVLWKEKRLDDLQRATEDKVFCEQLLKEYGIE